MNLHGRQTGLYELHRTSTTVNTASSDISNTQTSIHGPLQLWELDIRTCTALKQACTTSTGLLRPPQDSIEEKMALSDLPSTQIGLYNCENWISGPSWLWNRAVQRSQNLNGRKNGFIWYSKHLNTRLRASHDLYSCEKWLSRHWNRPVWRPQEFYGSENSFIWPSQLLNSRQRVSHDLDNRTNSICGATWQWKRPVQVPQYLYGSVNALISSSQNLNWLPRAWTVMAAKAALFHIPST